MIVLWDRWKSWIGARGFCSEHSGEMMPLDLIHLHPALRLRKIETEFSSSQIPSGWKLLGTIPVVIVTSAFSGAYCAPASYYLPYIRYFIGFINSPWISITTYFIVKETKAFFSSRGYASLLGESWDQILWSHLNVPVWGLDRRLSGKSTHCSRKGPEFSSQHPL